MVRSHSASAADRKRARTPRWTRYGVSNHEGGPYASRRRLRRLLSMRAFSSSAALRLETPAHPRALFPPQGPTGRPFMWTVLVAAVLVVCVASSADARRRHHSYYGDGERGSARSLDEWRARQSQGQNEQGQDRDQA